MPLSVNFESTRYPNLCRGFLLKNVAKGRTDSFGGYRGGGVRDRELVSYLQIVNGGCHRVEYRNTLFVHVGRCFVVESSVGRLFTSRVVCDPHRRVMVTSVDLAA